MTLEQRLQLKRVFDLIVAAGATLVLLPFLAVIALAIRLDSRGPALFVQERYGQHNRVFRMWKFRTLQATHCGGQDASGRLLLVKAEDPRVTRIGRFLRRFSIDELPQLWNVLRGEMSIVGPRPHVVNAAEDGRLYEEISPRYFDRHVVRPGLTGLAQAQGYRGVSRRANAIAMRTKMDLFYCRHACLALDMAIIIKTLQREIFRGCGV